MGLDHPNRYDKVFAVDGGELRAHAENSAASTGNRCFIQMSKGADQLVARINRSLDFQRMQHAVVLDDHIDLVAVAAPVIPQQALLRVVMVGLQQFANNVVFQDRAVHRAVCKDLRRGIAGQICHQSRIEEIHLRGFHGTLQQIIGIGSEEEDDIRFLQYLKPALCGIVRHTYVLRNVIDV